jgi:hypothetical protein
MSLVLLEGRVWVTNLLVTILKSRFVDGVRVVDL